MLEVFSELIFGLFFFVKDHHFLVLKKSNL